ncbi:hypothetical protein LX69_00772 [Breznakibacter xylanolyticus]|uniref:Uncharacterized protein n=1 Tax=Breznakibacter xylanolyticus TaxID=990 RepID=A0A2W7NSA5_9BACT|nr:hypothetical protein LX69_00772 [Breznakibacter xylanolyticus]
MTESKSTTGNSPRNLTQKTTYNGQYLTIHHPINGLKVLFLAPKNMVRK